MLTQMFVQLCDVLGWRRGVSCVPTALCAVSACELDRIGRVLQTAAQRLGVNIPQELQSSYEMNTWLAAIAELGGRCTEVLHWDSLPYQQRPDIDFYMAQFRNEQLQLVFGENPSAAENEQTHLFARCGQTFVDIYTAGRVQNFERTISKYLPFRIKRVFAVEPA
jgi:hypothetical protein